MQILEQLACGYDMNVTTESVLTECASMQGYLECMMEMTESEVVTEGIDVKAFLKKIWAIIKGILAKIRQMLKKLISFLRGRKDKLKQKKVDEPKSGDNKNSGGGSEDMSDRDDSSTTTDAKSKDKMIEDIFKNHPYTGINPKAINLSFVGVFKFESVALGIGINLAGSILQHIAELISNTDFSSEGGLEQFKKHFKLNIEPALKSVMNMRDAGPKAFIDNIMGRSLVADLHILKEEVSSPQDFKKVPMIIYNYHRRNKSLYRDYSDTVFDTGRFNHFVKKYNSAIDINSKYTELITQDLKDNDNLISEFNSLCRNISEFFDEIPEFDHAYLMKAFSATTDMLNLAAQVVTYTSMGVSEFCSKVDSDLNNIGNYIDTVNSALSAIN